METSLIDKVLPQLQNVRQSGDGWSSKCPGHEDGENSLSVKHHGLPVLGIPGASMTKLLKIEHVDGIPRLYICKEPDSGGVMFVNKMLKRLRRIAWSGCSFILTLPDGTKDPNDLHKRVPAEEFRAAIERAMETASATADTPEEEIPPEQVLFFLYGLGANGKTKFLRALLELLGEYARQAEPDLLVAKRGETHPTGVADLRGARFVALSEVREERRLAETLLKQLTGGDVVKARLMRQDFFEFEPTWKLFIAGNHKPGVRGTDHAIWRRIRLIPFDVQIQTEQQDKALLRKLRAEGPGIDPSRTVDLDPREVEV